MAAAASTDAKAFTQAHIQRMEKGKSWTIENLFLMADAFGVSASFLLGEDAAVSPHHAALLKYLQDGDFEKFFLVLAPLLPSPSRE